jgi:hypothetical protein
MMSRLIVIVNGHQKTLERHERILDDIRAQDD